MYHKSTQILPKIVSMNTIRKCLNVVAPLRTRRRLIVSLFKDMLYGTGFHRISYKNYLNWNKFKNCEFRCNVCSCRGKPFYDFPDVKLRKIHKVGLLRETLACKDCGSTVRTRTLAYGFLKAVNERLGTNIRDIEELSNHGLRGLRVLDTDAFSPISVRLTGVDGYIRSSFLPEHPFGAEVEKGYFNINLEAISFGNSSFDIVLSSDVMEHVRYCDRAHEEIYRVIKSDGVYVFNVPNDMKMKDNWILVDPNDNDRVLVNPPHYHGDPLTGGILSYRVFGQELLSYLTSIGFVSDYFLIQEPEILIVDGDLFVAAKHGQDFRPAIKKGSLVDESICL